jgi:hypothetical protein
MTNSPGYHVQSTGTVLRDGFPYFAHHDSVSALWSKKWRGPCAAGIYPFVDGDVEDFDPIFAELTKLSGDDPSLLGRPDDYAKPFLPVAERLVAQAEERLARGDRESARELFHRAAAVYRIARFPINRSPISQEAWVRGKAAYERGGALLDPPSVAIDIPFTAADPAAGDRGTVIAAYLRVPPGPPPDDGWPVLLFICGLDAYKTDNTRRIQQHNDQGLATVMFEIPGTGDCPAAPGDPTSPDRLMTSVLDWVTANASTYALDPRTVVARGISTGGYYAFRLAHTHADRLFAVAAQGGGCHHMFDAQWIGAQNQMEYPFSLADALAYKFGYRDADVATSVRRYAEGAHAFSLLDPGILDSSSCRLLVLDGMEDSIFPIEDNFIVATRGTGKDLLARGSLSHMGNPGGEEILVAWLDQVLAGRSF